MSEVPKAVEPVVHGGYPDAQAKPYRGPIILQIARASDDHEIWARRFRDVRRLPSFNRSPEFEDRDGEWSMAGLLDYMASACGWDAGGVKS